MERHLCGNLWRLVRGELIYGVDCAVPHRNASARLFSRLLAFSTQRCGHRGRNRLSDRLALVSPQSRLDGQSHISLPDRRVRRNGLFIGRFSTHAAGELGICRLAENRVEFSADAMAALDAARRLFQQSPQSVVFDISSPLRHLPMASSASRLPMAFFLRALVSFLVLDQPAFAVFFRAVRDAFDIFGFGREADIPL